MSTFLQLAQSLRQEVGASGTGPTAVTGQTGEYADLVTYIKDAWIEIQNRRQDWLWMNQEFSEFTMTATDDNYSASDLSITDLSRWDQRFMKIGLSTSDEYELRFVTWPAFQRRYKLGVQTNAKPIYVCIKPDKSLIFGPKPDQAYKLNGSYWQQAVTLSADGDIPAMPTEYHMLIVYKAMMYFGAYDDAPNIYTDGEMKFKRMYADLVRNQTEQPSLKEAEALA